MENEVTTLEKNTLKMIVEDAKKRILFYYKDKLDEKELQNIETLLNEYTYGFDLKEERYIAYCEHYNKIINVTSHFLEDIDYEQQVGVMIHEMNHAISGANKNNSKVPSDAYYISSYKIIEEGLADITSELIMNYYYDKNNPSINYEPYRNISKSCGYPTERQILKTILIITESQGIDKEMIKEYYFGDKNKFFEKVKEIGGEKIFDLIKEYSNLTDAEETIKKYEIYQESFKTLEESWGKTLSNKSNLKLYNNPEYNNVYYKENTLLECIHISYCIEKLIDKLDINIDNITSDDIEKIYNQTNGLIEKISYNFIPTTIDRIITSWFENCKIEEINLIKKIIPDIYEIENGKYYYMLIDKALKCSTDDKISSENLSIILESMPFDYVDEELISSEVFEESLDYQELGYFTKKIYSRINNEQKELLKNEHKELYKCAEKTKNYYEIYDEFLDTYHINSIEDFDGLDIFDLIKNHQELVDKIKEKNVTIIINKIVELWLKNYIGEPDYIFTVFPSALNNLILLELLKENWGYTDESIENLKNRITNSTEDDTNKQM